MQQLSLSRQTERPDVGQHKPSNYELSFVIPALNEERYISRCVAQFEKLNGVCAFEVIVADSDSSDRTAEIARQLGAKVYVDHTRKKNIASGRNFGARYASGELLVFCDADTYFEDIIDFTKSIIDLFNDNRLVGLVPEVQVIPAERRWSDRLYWTFLNHLFSTVFVLGLPFASGQCQVVRKSSFDAINGYDASKVHGEDSDLFQRLSRIGQLKFLWGSTIFESPRRYRQVGYPRLMLTGLSSIIGQKILGRNILSQWKRVD